ncbi:MAG: WG repeat-containing protein [Flavobacteriaceae bacterium]|nr:WG repeat-containing protein [Flavobacteriaceae bacterium]
MKKILLMIVPLLLASCSFFKSSKDIELIPYAQKEKYGYFDLEGKIVINPQFAYATAFREGIALVKATGDKGKWGYIEKSGKFIINATYKDATVFQEGLAWVILENGAPTAIDKKGEIKFTLKEAEDVRLFSENLAAFSKVDSTSTTWGFIDQSGKQVINPQFDAVGDFHDGKCAIKNKDGKWGYIDKAGKIIINPQFDSAAGFKDGKAVVSLDEKAGVIDKDGKYIINPQFGNAYADGDKYLINQDDKYGWCDREGKIIINPQFDDALFFGDSKLASIKSSDKWGYIDDEGKFMINPQFDYALPFMNNLAIVKSGGKYGLIDKEGKYKVNPQFDDIGEDIIGYLFDYSTKGSITSDYLDTDKILKVINVDKPENLNFTDDSQTILNKTGKSINDFNAYEKTQYIFENKAITNEASYGFAVLGKLVDYDYNYNKIITKEKQQGFFYYITLKGKAIGKAESVQKAFEKKLNGYTLMKKGYVNGNYTSVYKSDKNIVVTSSYNSSNMLFHILNKDFDISEYLNKIVEKSDETASDYDEAEAPAEEVAADTTAVAVDSADTSY